MQEVKTSSKNGRSDVCLRPQIHWECADLQRGKSYFSLLPVYLSVTPPGNQFIFSWSSKVFKYENNFVAKVFKSNSGTLPFLSLCDAGKHLLHVKGKLWVKHWLFYALFTCEQKRKDNAALVPHLFISLDSKTLQPEPVCATLSTQSLHLRWGPGVL